MASLGAEVYGISRTAQNLESLKKECPSINTICQDIGDWNGTRAAVEKLPVMDGLVNNAGINTQQSFLEVTEDKLDRYFPSELSPNSYKGEFVKYLRINKLQFFVF